MEKGFFKEGKCYEVYHCRKGVFKFYCEKVFEDDSHFNDTVRGLVIEGMADSILPENQKFEGDPIDMVIGLITKAKEIK